MPPPPEAQRLSGIVCWAMKPLNNPCVTLGANTQPKLVEGGCERAPPKNISPPSGGVYATYTTRLPAAALVVSPKYICRQSPRDPPGTCQVSVNPPPPAV